MRLVADHGSDRGCWVGEHQADGGCWWEANCYSHGSDARSLSRFIVSSRSFDALIEPDVIWSSRFSNAEVFLRGVFFFFVITNSVIPRMLRKTRSLFTAGLLRTRWTNVIERSSWSTSDGRLALDKWLQFLLPVMGGRSFVIYFITLLKGKSSTLFFWFFNIFLLFKTVHQFQNRKIPWSRQR
jgi:hypothetical protein